MSAAPRLLLKHSTGWFAAGREVAEALALLPDAAFRLYLYICLNADRHTGTLGVDTVNWARALRKDPAAIEQHLGELRGQRVCRRQRSSSRSAIATGPMKKGLPPCWMTGKPNMCGPSARPFWRRHACVPPLRRPTKSWPQISFGEACRRNICGELSGWDARVNTWPC
jgi:hypothetical protein